MPLNQIASLEHTREAPDQALSMALLGSPQVLITLRGPVTARGAYGLTRRVGALRLKVDEPERFVAHLRARLAEETGE